MPAVMQAKLLRVLEEGEIERVGGSGTQRVDVRVVVATHRNLEELVRTGAFRQDLYHRILVFPILLPPLRDRKEDIAALVEHFSRLVSEINGWKPKPFAPEAIDALTRYSWPGNVRELRNVVERLLLLADEQVDEETARMVLPQMKPRCEAFGNARRDDGELRTRNHPQGAGALPPQHDRSRAGTGIGAQPSLQEMLSIGNRRERATEIGRMNGGTSALEVPFP